MNDFNYRFTVKIACNFRCGLKQSCNVLLLVLLFLLFFTLDILLKIWYIVALFWRGRKKSTDWCEFLMKICIFPLWLHFFFLLFTKKKFTFKKKCQRRKNFINYSIWLINQSRSHQKLSQSVFTHKIIIYDLLL